MGSDKNISEIGLVSKSDINIMLSGTYEISYQFHHFIWL